MTHSAASQTVAQLVKEDLVARVPGEDARQRIIRLTPKAGRLLPVLTAEWEATKAAATGLEAELPFPLGCLVDETLAALDRCSMRQRIDAELSARSIGGDQGVSGSRRDAGS